MRLLWKNKSNHSMSPVNNSNAKVNKEFFKSFSLALNIEIYLDLFNAFELCRFSSVEIITKHLASNGFCQLSMGAAQRQPKQNDWNKLFFLEKKKLFWMLQRGFVTGLFFVRCEVMR